MALAWDCPVKALQHLWQLCRFSSPPGLCMLHRAQPWGCKQPPAPDLLTMTIAPLTPQVQTSSFAGSQTAQGAGVRSSCSWFLWKSSSSILQVLQPPFRALQSRKTAATITRNPSLPHKGGVFCVSPGISPAADTR